MTGRKRDLKRAKEGLTEADLTNNVWNKYLFVSDVMIGKWLTRPWRLARYIKKG